MSEPLSKETFEIYTREHQKYLDSSFEKLAVCVNSVKTSVDQVKTDRDKAWESHAQECAACRTCNDGKIKKLQKYLVIGCIIAALMGAILAPSLGWTHVAGFLSKLIFGAAPL